MHDTALALNALLRSGRQLHPPCSVTEPAPPAQLAPSDTAGTVHVAEIRPTITFAVPAQMDTTMTCPMLRAKRASLMVGARAATGLANGEHDNATPKEMRFVRLARQALPTM